MKRLPYTFVTSLLGLLVLAACSTTAETALPATVAPAPQPTGTEVTVLPTPASPGDTITWQDLRVTMDQVEVTDVFVTEFGSTRIPSAGEKFLWVHILLRNGGGIEVQRPRLEHYSVLYAATELKPIYGHRQDHPEYSDLEAVIYPGEQVDGWIRFDIPDTAELRDLRFAFLPESSQVGVSFSSPTYPYGEDKPIFVWECAP
jgi:hypothetical protein